MVQEFQMKKIIAAIAFVLCIATFFTACQPIPLDPIASDTTTSSSSGTNNPTDNRVQYPIMDLLSAQIEQYVTLGDYTAIKLEMSVDVSDEEITADLAAEMLSAAIDQKLYTLVTDRVTAKGDTLDINYSGKIDGVAFEGGTAENQKITLSEQTGYIDGFDADLYGIMPGTTVSTTVTFPDNYGATDLAGKEAVFEIKVNGIYGFDPTDENIKKLTDDEYSSYAELKEAYREDRIITNLKNYKNRLNAQILVELKNISEVVLVPEDQVNYYYYDMKYYYEDYYNANKSLFQLYYGITSYEQYISQMGLSDELMKDEAKLMALEDILLVSAAKKLGCIPETEEAYQAELTKLAAEAGFSSVETMIEEYGNEYLKLHITKELTLEKLIEEIEIVSDYDTYKHLLEEESAS